MCIEKNSDGHTVDSSQLHCTRTQNEDYIVLDDEYKVIAMATTLEDCKSLIVDNINMWKSKSTNYTIHKTIVNIPEQSTP